MLTRSVGIGLARGRALAEHRGMDEMTTEEHLQSPLLPRWFWWAVLGIAGLWLLGPQVVGLWMRMTGTDSNGVQSGASAGTFGDQFGAINTLFSGLAFLGVLAGLWIQGREFRHQLKEMQVNAEEMRAQSAIYGEQLAMLKRQNEMLDRQNALMGHQLVNAQVEERLAAQPFLVIKTNLGDTKIDIEVTNEGASIYGFEISTVEGPFEEVQKLGLLRNGSIRSCFLLLDETKPFRRVQLHVRYVTRLGMDRSESFVVDNKLAYHLNQGRIVQTDMRAIGQQIREEVEQSHIHMPS